MVGKKYAHVTLPLVPRLPAQQRAIKTTPSPQNTPPVRSIPQPNVIPAQPSLQEILLAGPGDVAPKIHVYTTYNDPMKAINDFKNYFRREQPKVDAKNQSAPLFSRNLFRQNDSKYNWV